MSDFHHEKHVSPGLTSQKPNVASAGLQAAIQDTLRLICVFVYTLKSKNDVLRGAIRQSSSHLIGCERPGAYSNIKPPQPSKQHMRRTAQQVRAAAKQTDAYLVHFNYELERAMCQNRSVVDGLHRVRLRTI